MCRFRTDRDDSPAGNRAPCLARGAMVYTFARTVTMHYTYINRQPGTVEIWLSVPPELPTQRRVQLLNVTPDPLSIQPDGSGINRIAFFRLRPGEALNLDVKADLYHGSYVPSAPSTTSDLSDDERRRFLRSSPMVRVTDEVRAEASSIVGDAKTPIERALRLYLHLVRRYRYKWPPPERGSEAMRRTRQGDCGQYSFLYAAWCRALDIPCRVMVGTFATGTLRAHVWNEVFIEGVGWLPVDTSLYQPSVRLPGLADLDLALLRIAWRFGRLSDDRLVFSIDPDVLLQPPYVDRQPPSDIERFPVADRELAWGFQSLDGAAPYLQPIYLRFDPDTYRTPRPNTRLASVWPELALGTVTSYLGKWWFDAPLSYRLGTWMMVGGFTLGGTGTLLGTLELADLGPLTALGYTVANVVFIQRTGAHWWKVLLLVLFLIELIVRLGKLFAA